MIRSMIDVITIIPPLPPYPGMTRLTVNARTFICVGTGEEVENALWACAARGGKAREARRGDESAEDPGL